MRKEWCYRYWGAAAELQVVYKTGGQTRDVTLRVSLYIYPDSQSERENKPASQVNWGAYGACDPDETADYAKLLIDAAGAALQFQVNPTFDLDKYLGKLGYIKVAPR